MVTPDLTAPVTWPEMEWVAADEVKSLPVTSAPEIVTVSLAGTKVSPGLLGVTV